jgi:hypothetical protein
MTIPAMAPPLRPFLLEPAGDATPDPAAEVAEVGAEVDDAVGALVENVMKAVIVGNTTPAHLSSALEL